VTQMETAAQAHRGCGCAHEKVAIFGDYDVRRRDLGGAAGLAPAPLRLDPLIHIPDRIFEGYGPNVESGARARG